MRTLSRAQIFRENLLALERHFQMKNPFDEIDQRFNQLENLLKKNIEIQSEAKNKTPETYLTRQATAEMLRVQLSTLNAWNKSGKLPAFGIGNRVFYKRSDIEKAMIPLSGSNVKRKRP